MGGMKYHIVKVVAIALGAIVFGSAIATAHGLAFEDALLDRLDRPTVAAVMDYVDGTWLSRSLGFSIQRHGGAQ
jgi:hypothetical protein